MRLLWVALFAFPRIDRADLKKLILVVAPQHLWFGSMAATIDCGDDPTNEIGAVCGLAFGILSRDEVERKYLVSGFALPQGMCEIFSHGFEAITKPTDVFPEGFTALSAVSDFE